jgi:putative transposase
MRPSTCPPPASRDDPSPRQRPNRWPLLEYPDRFEERDVSANGGIRWNHHWVNVSHTCSGEYVGLDDIDEGVWNVYCGPLTRGRLLERHRRIDEAYGRLKRRR